jgi:putative DNA primase/helicase
MGNITEALGKEFTATRPEQVYDNGIFELVKDRARGQWPELFAGLGIITPKKKKGGECPSCGGHDRFTYDDKFGNGNWTCRGCPPSPGSNIASGDGIKLISNVYSCSPLDAAKISAKQLGIDIDAPEPSDSLAAERAKQAAQRIAEQEAKQAKRYDTAAASAQYIWDNAQPAPADHGYLAKKGIRPHNARVTGDGRLVLPLMDRWNRVRSLQYISADGSKIFHTGGQAGGSFWRISHPSISSTIYLAEGFATAVSIHEATKACCFVAYNADNILKVAPIIQAQYPNHTIIVAADNDSLKQHKGRRIAEQCALEFGLTWSMPPTPGDWNDYEKAGHDVLAGLVANLVDSRPLPAAEARNALEQATESVLLDFMSVHPKLDDEGLTDFQHVLIKAGAGTGKSTTVLKVIRKLLGRIKHAEYYTPTLRLADELAEKARRMGIPTTVIRGRDSELPDNKKMCQRSEMAAILGRKGVNVFGSLCKKGTKKPVYCPHYRECAYLKQFNTNDPLRVHASAKFGMNRGLDAFEERGEDDHIAPDFAVIDEQLHPELIKSAKVDANKIAASVMSDKAKAILLNWLATGIKPEWCETLLLAESALKETKRKPSVSPDQSDQDVLAALADYKPEGVMLRLVQSIQSDCKTAVERTKSGEAFSIVWKSEIKRFDYKIDGQPHRIPVLNLDADGREEVVKAATGWNWKTTEINARRENVHFTHINKSFSKKELGLFEAQNERLKANAEILLDEVVAFIREQAAQHNKLLLVTYKALKSRLKALLPSNVSIETFGALRGIDAYKDADAAIILGRNQPNPTDSRTQARVLFEDKMLNDPSCEQTVIEMIRDDETGQGIDRLRLIGNEKLRYVFLLTNYLPKGIAPDEVKTWPEVKGTRKSGQAIIDQLVERFGGVPNVSLALKAANDILKAKDLNAAKQIYRRHVRPYLEGYISVSLQMNEKIGVQTPVGILTGNCTPNGLTVRKPSLSVAPDYSPEVINSRLERFGLIIIDHEETKQMAVSIVEQKEITKESPPPVAGTAEGTFQTACGATAPAAVDYQTQTHQPHHDPLELLKNDDEIELLPDDYKWLRGLLRSRGDEVVLLSEYKAKWLQAMNDLGLKSHERQNKGRLAANIWIRKTVNHQPLGATA